MARPPESASTIDNNKFHKSRDSIYRRQELEKQLQTSARNLICPDYLTTDAKVEWQRIVAIDNLRKPIIYDSDIAMLEVLCELWCIYINEQWQRTLRQLTVIKNQETWSLIHLLLKCDEYLKR